MSKHIKPVVNSILSFPSMSRAEVEHSYSVVNLRNGILPDMPRNRPVSPHYGDVEGLSAMYQDLRRRAHNKKLTKQKTAVK